MKVDPQENVETLETQEPPETQVSQDLLARLVLRELPDLLETQDHPDPLEPQDSLETEATLVLMAKREMLVHPDLRDLSDLWETREPKVFPDQLDLMA